MAKRHLRRFGKAKRLYRTYEQELPDEVRIQKELIELEAKLNKEWAEQNRHFKSDKYVRQWESNRDRYKKIFETLTIKYLSIINGAQEANELIRHGMKMQDAGIDLDAIQTLLSRLVKIDIANILVKDLNLEEEHFSYLITSIIAREFPNKRTGAPAPAPNSASTPIDRKQLMAKLIEKGIMNDKEQ